MPRVPVYGEQRINAQPLPNMQAPQAGPLAAFGGGRGVEEIHQQARGLAQDGGQILREQAEKEYNQTVMGEVAGYMNKLAMKETELQTQLSNVKGRDAYPAMDKAMEEYDKYHGEIQKSIVNPDVKDRVGKHYGQYKAGLHRWALPYASGQARAATLGELDALFKTEREALTLDTSPERVAEAINRRAALAEEMGKMMDGTNEETVKLMKARAESEVHMDVLGRLLDVERDMDAKAYFEVNRDKFYGKDRDKAQGAVSDGSTRGEATRIVDHLYGATINGETYTPSVKEALERARNIPEVKDNPKLRDAVEQKIKIRAHEEDVAAKQTEAAGFAEAYKLVESGRKIPPSLWDSFGPDSKDALDHLMARKAKGGDVVEDPKSPLWAKLSLQSEAQMAAMTEKDVLIAREYLNKPHFESLLDMIRAAKKATGGKAGTAESSMFTDKQMVLKTMARLGLGGITDQQAAAVFAGKEASSVLEPEQMVAFGAFSDAVGRKFMAEKKGEKLTDSEKLDVLAKWTPTLVREGGFKAKDLLYVAALGRKAPDPALLLDTLPANKRDNIYMMYEDIKPADREKILNDLIGRQSATGKKVFDGGALSDKARYKVERMYVALVRGDNDLYEQIARE